MRITPDKNRYSSITGYINKALLSSGTQALTNPIEEYEDHTQQNRTMIILIIS